MIFFASDHAAVEMRRHLLAMVHDQGFDVEDLGADGSQSVDYPDFAHALAARISNRSSDLGILLCGTGLGMSMAANRHIGIRAALCHDAYTAEMARRHNDANVLCLGARVLGEGVAEQIVRIFITTEFDGGRHARRVDKIETGV